jgi:hypothetical protein
MGVVVWIVVVLLLDSALLPQSKKRRCERLRKNGREGALFWNKEEELVNQHHRDNKRQSRGKRGLFGIPFLLLMH